jgi:hypothetical protein
MSGEGPARWSASGACNEQKVRGKTVFFSRPRQANHYTEGSDSRPLGGGSAHLGSHTRLCSCQAGEAVRPLYKERLRRLPIQPGSCQSYLPGPATNGKKRDTRHVEAVHLDIFILQAAQTYHRDAAPKAQAIPWRDNTAPVQGDRRDSALSRCASAAYPARRDGKRRKKTSE